MTETIEQQIQSLEQRLSADSASPIFAQLASFYLEAGRTQEALDLCDKGIAQHPFYSTGHLIKGKVLIALNMRAEARREFEFVHNQFPGNESIGRLVAQILPTDDEVLTLQPSAVEAAGTRTIKPKAKPQPSKPTAETAATSLTEVSEPSVSEAAPPEPFLEVAEPTQTELSSVEVPEPAAQEQAETLQPEATGGAVETFEAATPSEDVFGIESPAETPQEPVETFGTESISPEVPAAPPTESFELFAERKRGELFGLENSVSLDEYLEGSFSIPAPEPPAASEPAPEATAAPGDESQEDPFAQLQQTPDVSSTPPAGEESTIDPFAQLQQPSEATQSPTAEEEQPVGVSAEPEQASEFPVVSESPEDAFAQLRQTEPSPDSTPLVEEPPSVETLSDQFQESMESEQSPETPATEESSEDPFAQLAQLPESDSTSPVEEQPPAPPTQEGVPEIPAQEPPVESAGGDEIEELAQKLKDAKKITPIINFSEKSTPSLSESDSLAGTGFVTPTLAEIYAKQGWYDDAIKAYKTLALTKPLEKDRYEQRIQELEELKRQQESGG